MNKTKLKRITILIGPNGSGKTFFINKKVKDLYSAKNIFEVSNESLDDLYKNATSPLRKEINKILSTESNLDEINEKTFQNENLQKILKEQKNKIENPSSEKNLINKTNFFYSSDLKLEIAKEIRITRNFFESAHILRFNDHNIEIKTAPSGVKRLFLLCLEAAEKLNDKSKEKTDRLLLIEEIENYLHPNWIKLCVAFLKAIFESFEKDEKIKFIITTHNPEVLIYLNQYIEFFATPTIDYKNGVIDDVHIDYINLKNVLKKYNDINEAIEKHTELKDTKALLSKINSRWNLELVRFLFSKNSSVFLCEGITDHIFIRNHTEKLVIPTFGYYNFGLYLALYFGFYGDLKGIKIIVDGDGEAKEKEDRCNLKKKLIKELKEDNIFYFDKDIERDLYPNLDSEYKKRHLNGYTKFRLLEKNCSEPPSKWKNKNFLEWLKKK